MCVRVCTCACLWVPVCAYEETTLGFFVVGGGGFCFVSKGQGLSLNMKATSQIDSELSTFPFVPQALQLQGLCYLSVADTNSGPQACKINILS